MRRRPVDMPGVFDELRELRVDAESRILEVDRVDRMRGDRDLDARVADDAFAVEGDQSRQPPARLSVIHAVEIDPAHLFAVAIRVHDARAQATRDERQVRVGVARLDGALGGVEIAAAFEADRARSRRLRGRARGTHRRTGDALSAQTRRKTAIEEAGGRVKRPIEAMRVRRRAPRVRLKNGIADRRRRIAPSELARV